MSGKSELRGRGLRPSAATGHGLPGHFPGTGIAEIGLFGAASCVGEIDAHHGTFSLVDFLAAIVADESRYACQGFSS